MLYKNIVAIFVIRLALKHNIFIHYLKISIKVIGLDSEIKSKEKDTPSCKAMGSLLRCMMAK